ncbi:inactive polyglycylase TTLL10 isoform X1 [Fukomys damarensis]|uniref:inactive polyglycylase TTLL10 isoform X1 n=2 Tax=Fukomys damarensis TaxID=885580 RepID=UPI0005400643|nr:inactive polyglycylase TTLL10 isoform X1 [Fukomys damarensis]XP_010625977.1 inactive polyglycylase TTLL10 isoform X1 [Fukomys damarensis]XP_019063513.1 inactive polyglycylase TTLL10 isoform X1 [Fukomys damarensis]
MQTSTLQATRPHSRRRDRNQLQAEATVLDKRKQAPLGRVGLTLCPIQEQAPQAARRPHRRTSQMVQMLPGPQPSSWKSSCGTGTSSCPTTDRVPSSTSVAAMGPPSSAPTARARAGSTPRTANGRTTGRNGQQLLLQLPNNKLLTTKIGLLSALWEHERTLSKVNQMPPGAQARVPKMEDFFPETYRLDISNERQTFFALFDETQIWICKPTASNKGKGIFLIRSQEELAILQAKTHSTKDGPLHSKTSFRGPQARVVQRYIQNPLLLNGKKFDVRSYLPIACAVPYMVFFGHGYARLTLNLYDPHSSDLSGHLTNQFMQKQSPLYMLLKEDTVWSMDHLNHYINDKFQRTKGLPRDWVFTTFTRRMQQIMTHCFLAVKSKLERKLGYFDLIGCDFLIDENFKVWLLEMNSNPALHTNCEVLKKVIPGVVMETLDLALETSQKSLRGQKMLPMRSQRRFTLLHNGEADQSPNPRLRPAASSARLRPPAPPRPRPPGPTPGEQPSGRRGTGQRGC